MTISSGSRIGRYEIRSKIGEGGMGEVYLAQDTKLDRKVALKILPAELAGNTDRMRRFVQEAKAASALNHPNIITIYEIDETESGHFIATEFIDGETLRERALKAPLPLGESLDIAAQIASALSAAHAAGIIHRDIKPENVMRRADGIVKVLDFGLAKLTSPASLDSVDGEAPTRPNVNTDPNVVMGTAIYMSPEQARGLPVDARADIFSLGIVLYEMVAGRLPFEGSNRNEIMATVLSDKEPQPLTRYSSEAPNELGRIVLKALRKNRDERYQTIKDMLLDLQSLKQELEFERKLELSKSGSVEAAAVANQRTEIGRAGADAQQVAATSPPTAQASSAQYIVSRIKQNKLSAVIGIGVLLVAALGTGYWLFSHRVSTPATTIDSIAVLPFENATHDQNNEYLSDGVTESLINKLSQLPNVRVIGRNSVFSYKGQTTKLPDIARQLNVRAVLTGRILMQGDTLDVRVELTDMQNNTQLWGDHYPRKAADIFAVQDEIARQVTDALRVRLTGAQQEQITKRYTENAEAYGLYLQGRHLMNDFSEDNLNRAIPLFDKAIALDPRYALAYAARGESVFVLGDISLPMSEAKRKVEQDIAAALSIDDKLAEARLLRANIEFQYDWNFAKAEEDFKQVIALNPNYAEAHHQYGAFYLPMMGRPMEGAAEMRLAQQLDPVNPGINVDVCLPYYLARQYDQSIAELRKTLEMFPNFFLPHIALGQALFQKGDYAAGIQEIEKGNALEPTPPAIGQLGYAYAKAGRKDEARKLLAELKKQSKERYVASYWIAMIYVGLDEKDEAFAWLEKAYQERSWWLVWIRTDPMVDSLRPDPRFTDLMRRVGFSQ
jgi:serine/threonine protein kinase/Tfp pilus assembly protein PilF